MLARELQDLAPCSWQHNRGITQEKGRSHDGKEHQPLAPPQTPPGGGYALKDPVVTDADSKKVEEVLGGHHGSERGRRRPVVPIGAATPTFGDTLSPQPEKVSE